MRSLFRDHRIAGFVLALWLAMTAGSAWAAGTLSNTQINNRASVNYDVLGVAQTVIESSPSGNTTAGAGSGTDTQFLVDNRVDLTVAELSSSFTLVAAGGTEQVLVYRVTNTGNTVQDFLLTAADVATGTPDPFAGTLNDSFDATNAFLPAPGVFVDAGGDGLYVAGVDTATFIDELAPDASVDVLVVRNIPGGQVDDDVSSVVLTAQVAQGGSATVQGAAIVADDSAAADLPGTVQIVFGDGAGDTDAALDGMHSDTDAYRVASAQLTITKTSQVLSDPFTTSGNPKAIPGAIVEYTITVANAAGAGAPATNVSVADSLAAEIGAGRLLLNADAYDSGPGDQGIEVTAPNINGGAPLALSNAADADQGSFVADVVTVTGIDLNPGQSATVTFQVEIQ